MPDFQTLAEALPKEIERCQELMAEYKKIRNGKFGALMIEHEIAIAHKAIIEQDLPMMIKSYESLKACQ